MSSSAGTSAADGAAASRHQLADTSSSPQRVILRMQVQLPDGQKGTIHVFPGSDPRQLAREFCASHGLTDPKLRTVVERHIASNLASLPQRKAQLQASRQNLSARLLERGARPQGDGLSVARQLAVRWKVADAGAALLARCWHALHRNVLIGRAERRDAQLLAGVQLDRPSLASKAHHHRSAKGWRDRALRDPA